MLYIIWACFRNDVHNYVACRIIRALDDVSHLFQLGRSGTKRFIKRFFLAEVLQQLPTDKDLTVGISLRNNKSETIDNDSTIKSIKEGDGVNSEELDVGIFLPVELLKGNYHVYMPIYNRYTTILTAIKIAFYDKLVILMFFYFLFCSKRR